VLKKPPERRLQPRLAAPHSLMQVSLHSSWGRQSCLRPPFSGFFGSCVALAATTLVFRGLLDVIDYQEFAGPLS
jgi:hypothetical protein